MLKSYLNNVLPEIPDFKNIDTQLLSADGYDAVFALLQNLRVTDYPCVILEDPVSGSFGCFPGGSDEYTQSLWVMVQLNRNETPSEGYERARQYAMQIMQLFTRDYDTQWYGILDLTNIPYNKRSGAGSVGYELLLYMHTDINI